jgi:hypothetical protein
MRVVDRTLVGYLLLFVAVIGFLVVFVGPPLSICIPVATVVGTAFKGWRQARTAQHAGRAEPLHERVLLYVAASVVTGVAGIGAAYIVLHVL